jgi:hypothetical protein
MSLKGHLAAAGNRAPAIHASHVPTGAPAGGAGSLEGPLWAAQAGGITAQFRAAGGRGWRGSGRYPPAAAALGSGAIVSPRAERHVPGRFRRGWPLPAYEVRRGHHPKARKRVQIGGDECLRSPRLRCRFRPDPELEWFPSRPAYRCSGITDRCARLANSAIRAQRTRHPRLTSGYYPSPCRPV